MKVLVAIFCFLAAVRSDPATSGAGNDTDAVIARGLFPLGPQSASLRILSETARVILSRDSITTTREYLIQNTGGDSRALRVATICGRRVALDGDCGETLIDGALPSNCSIRPRTTTGTGLRALWPSCTSTQRSSGPVSPFRKSRCGSSSEVDTLHWNLGCHGECTLNTQRRRAERLAVRFCGTLMTTDQSRNSIRISFRFFIHGPLIVTRFDGPLTRQRGRRAPSGDRSPPRLEPDAARPNKRLKLPARVGCGMNLSSARRSLSAIR